MLALAAFLVVAFAWMALSLSNNYTVVPTEDKMAKDEIQKINTQSKSDTTSAIEKDLKETNLDNMDKELQDIDKELNQGY